MTKYNNVVMTAYQEIIDLIVIPESAKEYLLAQIDYVYAMGILEGILSKEDD